MKHSYQIFNFGSFGWPVWHPVSLQETRYFWQRSVDFCEQYEEWHLEHLIDVMSEHLLDQVLFGDDDWQPDDDWYATAVFLMALRGQIYGEIPEVLVFEDK